MSTAASSVEISNPGRGFEAVLLLTEKNWQATTRNDKKWQETTRNDKTLLNIDMEIPFTDKKHIDRMVMLKCLMVHLKRYNFYSKSLFTLKNTSIIFSGETKVIQDLVMQKVILPGEALVERQ